MELRISLREPWKIVEIIDDGNPVYTCEYPATDSDEEISDDMQGILEKYKRSY